MTHLKELFIFNRSQDSFLRPLGSGMSMGVPVLLAFLLKDMQVATLGVMGSFAYLSFQKKSLLYNMKAISIHGILLVLSFTLGVYSVMVPSTIPFVISMISFAGFIITKIYRIPKPDYFFIIMLFATGVALPSGDHVFATSAYLFFGVGGALFSGLVISVLEKLPLRQPKAAYANLSLPDKYYVTIYHHPDVILKALHFSMILFCAAYISYLLRDYNGHWILISTSSVLAGEYPEKIKERSYQRVLGSVIGLTLGFILISLDLPTTAKLCLLIPLNIGVEYFMSRNYAVANIFTNPQVLLLVSLMHVDGGYTIIYHRLFNLIIGVCITISFILLTEYSIKTLNRRY